MFYEMFDISDSPKDNNVSEDTMSSGTFESIENEELGLTLNEIMALETLGELYNVNDLDISMEDGPFDDLGGGDAGGDADMGGGDEQMDDGGDMGGDDGGEGAFSDLGGDQDEDPFGDQGGGDDGMGGDGDADGNNEDGQNEEKQKGPKKLNRRKVIIDSTSVDTSIRGFIPQNFYKMIDIIENNINKIEALSNISASQQRALGSLVEVYTKMKQYLQDYFKTMPRRTYDDIFSEYIKTFYDLKQLRSSYLTIMNEKELDDYDSITTKFNNDLRILTKQDVTLKEEKEKEKK